MFYAYEVKYRARKGDSRAIVNRKSYFLSKTEAKRYAHSLRKQFKFNEGVYLDALDQYQRGEIDEKTCASHWPGPAPKPELTPIPFEGPATKVALQALYWAAIQCQMENEES